MLRSGGVEGGAAARGEEGAQELVDAGGRPAVVAARDQPAHDRLGDRARRRLEQAEPRQRRRQEPLPAPVAQPGERRAEQDDRSARSGALRPTSIATRPPMLLPIRWARSISSASSSAIDGPGEVGGVVGGGDRLVGVAEAGQVDRDHAVVVGERRARSA